MSHSSFPDVLLGIYEAEGFHFSNIEGIPGEETITLVNDSGEEMTINFGFTSHPGPKNIMFPLPQVERRHDTTPILITTKVDYGEND